MKTTSLALGATVLALLVAGCGGSDNKTSSTSTDGGVRGYAQTGQAMDAICAQARAETKPLSKEASGSAKHDAPLLEKLVAINAKYVAQIKAIQPDPKLQDAFDRYTAALDEAQAAAKNLLGVAKRGDDTAYQTSAEALHQLDQKTNTIARELGAKECAKSS